MNLKCKLFISLTRLKATYICPWLNDLCLSKSKRITPAFILKPCTLWTVHAHDSMRGN